MLTDEFKRALARVYDSGELDAIITCDYYYPWERRRAKKDKKRVEDAIARFGSVEAAPFAMLLYGVRSVEVLKSVITYMRKEGDLC